MLTRRLFAKRAPMAAAAVPMMLPQALHETAGGAATMLGGDVNGRAISPAPPSSPGDWKLMDKAWGVFHRERQERQAARERRHSTLSLLGGLDPDLLAIRSMPLTQKARIQIERNQARELEDRTWDEKLKASIGKRFGLGENW